MRRAAWIFSAVVLLAPPAALAQEIGPLTAPIKAVGKEGEGNVEARAAWKKLAALPAAKLPEVLKASNGAGPVAANWLRAAVDTIGERAEAGGTPLPKEALEAFVRDRQNDGWGRRLAYDWLVRADPAAPGRLLPGML